MAELLDGGIILPEDSATVRSAGEIALEAAQLGKPFGNGCNRLFRPDWSPATQVVVRLESDSDGDEIVDVIVQERADICNGIVIEKLDDRRTRVYGSLTRSLYLGVALEFEFDCLFEDGRSTPRDIEKVAKHMQAFYEQFSRPTA